MTSPLRRTILWVAILFAVLLLSACANARPVSAPTAEIPSPTPKTRQALPQVSTGGETTPTPTSSAQGAAAEPGLPQPTVWNPRAVAAQVQIALAKRLDTKPEDIPWVKYVAQVDPKTLKCLDQLVGNVPRFGEGEALVFKHKDVPIYVVSSQGTLWICQPVTFQIASEGMDLEKAKQEAINNLAQRLGIDAKDVTVVEAREVTWADTSLGCPEPGKAYAQVLTPGYLIVLKANGLTYEYHGSAKTLFLCGQAEKTEAEKSTK